MEYLHCTHLTGHIHVYSVMRQTLTYWLPEENTSHDIKSYVTQTGQIKRAYCSSFQNYYSPTNFWPEETLVIQHTVLVRQKPAGFHMALGDRRCFFKSLSVYKEHQLVTLTLKLTKWRVLLPLSAVHYFYITHIQKVPDSGSGWPHGWISDLPRYLTTILLLENPI